MLLVDDLAAGGTKNLRHTPRGLVTLMCVVTKSLSKREDAPTVYLAIAWMQLSVAMYR